MADDRTPAKRETPRELQPDRRPWEKQPWESFKAFESFALYRDLGLARSLSKATQALIETVPARKAETVRTQMGGWSALNRWVERAEAYDLHVDARMLEQREGRVGRMNRRYEAAAATLSARALSAIAGGTDENGDTVEPVSLDGMDAEALMRILVNAQKVERLATGQPTELVKGAFLISSADVEKIARDLTEGLMQFVAPERQPLAAQWVVAYASGGGQAAGRLAA